VKRRNTLRPSRGVYSGKGVELRANHALKILTLFLEDALTPNEVEKWADLVECREDIYFEKSSKQWIDRVIHELANPLLTRSLDKQRANELIEGMPTK
jgi:hypothetical protein